MPPCLPGQIVSNYIERARRRVFQAIVPYKGSDLVVITVYTTNSVLESTLYHFYCDGGIHTCRWEEMDKKLKIPREKFVAMPIPENYVDCYEI